MVSVLGMIVGGMSGRMVNAVVRTGRSGTVLGVTGGGSSVRGMTVGATAGTDVAAVIGAIGTGLHTDATSGMSAVAGMSGVAGGRMGRAVVAAGGCVMTGGVMGAGVMTAGAEVFGGTTAGVAGSGVGAIGTGRSASRCDGCRSMRRSPVTSWTRKSSRS
ncbi:hypothetical protein [Streptomyces axinellae]|uniref:hypothetical protein n=1 Tax=Streptomyces axinellae TaxID=552788 RepID=UPI0031D5BDF6